MKPYAVGFTYGVGVGCALVACGFVVLNLLRLSALFILAALLLFALAFLLGVEKRRPQ
jgi:hypothetical protein